MFKFVIKIEDEEWEVFEGTWAQFLGLINSPQARAKGHVGGVPTDIQLQLLAQLWTI